MPVPNLSVDWAYVQQQTSRLQSLSSSLSTPSTLSVHHRKLVAEIILVRLFLLVENTIRSTCTKILAGAYYLDGSMPQRLVNARSTKQALDLMRNHSRTSPKNNLRWTQSSDIRDNVSLTLARADPLFTTISNNGTLLTDMRYARNQIAHANTATRTDFRKLIRKHYGGLKRGVTPGVLLLTSSIGSSPLLDQYIVSSRVLIRDLLRA